MVSRAIAAKRLGFRSRAFARHVLQKLGTLSFGALYVSTPGRGLRALLAGRGAVVEPLPLKVAVIAHAYYPDLIGEVLACRDVLPKGTPAFLTVPHDKLAAAEAATAGAENVTLIPVANRGRDIGPFMTVLASGRLDGFEAVLKIHTKRSPHLLDGEIRRKLLFDALCGGGKATARILASFLKPETGVAGWASCYRFEPPYWMANKARVEALVARFGVTPPVRLGFFEGSMFWFRPAALAPLVALGLTEEDYEPEAGQVDGTLHHALERVFTIAAWSRGYVVRDLKGRVLEGNAEVDR